MTIEIVKQLLEKLHYKGRFVQLIKNSGAWEEIVKYSSHISSATDIERIYLYINQETLPMCDGNRKRIYLGMTRGYGPYCKNYLKECNACTVAYKAARLAGLINKLGVDNPGKLPKAKQAHKEFYKDVAKVAKAKKQATATSLERYGVENPMQSEEIKNKHKSGLLEKYGVENASQINGVQIRKEETSLKNYGVRWPMQSQKVQETKKENCRKKYGTDYPMQSENVKNKMMETKIKRGTFAKSNVSKEATHYFRKYIQEKGYDLPQVAYEDAEYGLHEWGYYFDQWYLYDFVAFEEGHRGNKDKIIEIIEYNGPFHYTLRDVEEKGNSKAVPWKSSTKTVKESFEHDVKKIQYAYTLTPAVHIIWPEKWHKDKK